MPIYTFSTPAKRPADEEMVLRIKDQCERRGLSFSALVVRLLSNYEKEQSNEQRPKV